MPEPAAMPAVAPPIVPEGPKRATLAELAQRTGLTKPTLSRALNDYPDIAEATKRRVRLAAAELGYQASSRARQLSRGKAEAIGFVTAISASGLRSAYQSEFTNALALALAERGHDLLLHAVADPSQEVAAYARLAQEGKVDGFILMGTRHQDPRLAYLTAHGLPFVAQGRFEGQDDQAWLDIDAEQGFFRVAQHLIEQGHRRIAYLAGDPKVYSSQYREAGVARALADAGLALADRFDGDFSAEAGRRALTRAVADTREFTALICANDAMAMGAVSAAGALGVRIPDDLSITGYDGVRLAEVFNPPITTLSHSAADCGAAMATMIVGLIQGQAPRDLQRLIQPTLILRGSTSPAL